MVNVTDVEDVTEYPENILSAIFEKQKQLADKYAEIEGMGDLLNTTDTNINTANGQKWIKDFAWRVTEEICEALEAKEQKENLHYIEEMTDALHFLTELMIICGYSAEDLKGLPPSVSSREMNVVYTLGLAMNCLKNKPWKQTQMLTDEPKFKQYILKSYLLLLGIYGNAGYSEKDIYNIYFKKNAVNQFRQRSKY